MSGGDGLNPHWCFEHIQWYTYSGMFWTHTMVKWLTLINNNKFQQELISTTQSVFSKLAEAFSFPKLMEHLAKICGGRLTQQILAYTAI